MPPSHETSARDNGPSGWLIFAFAVACGITVANVYYAQPLVGPISASFGISVDAGSFMVTMIQLGYV
ncbi:MAG: arabinose efflux permease family protein, partial [Tardiphaga sp.]|nr:arabinose efflux permease family protein [Tardiphaga sp.]